MRTFSWTGGNTPLSEDEFNELASTDSGLREMRYPRRYQRSDNKTLTGMYVTLRHYDNVREFSQEQYERAVVLYNKRREQVLKEAGKRETLTLVGMGCEYKSLIPGDIGNHRVRAYLIDSDGETQFIEIHPKGFSSVCPMEGFYGEQVFCSLNERNGQKANELRKKYQEQNGEWWWIKLSNKEKEELEHLEFHQYKNIDSNLPFTDKGVLDYVNNNFGTSFTRLFYDYNFLNSDDIKFNPSHC